MEEDIKILEGMLGFISILNIEQRQALENLIKGYRELEEREIWSTATINGLKRDFIPKSKIKEKIEELNKEEKDLQDSVSDEEREQYSDASIGYGLMLIENQRTVLQELMEDK